ncbi:sarcosine oxidase subunit alpha [Zhengella mangrovi]|uniref:Sarcosine oxidase subunit alpha n=1 Tax=Zhengella mangrovi TaxID=1982044 RepID=A0A2G1QLN4_9HYPH|nr:sarcosine oxidase subunit alpha [Zhengella mangrovi]PHP66445.1 sarcosine oxidase subunit alpha [Zhengella mangrovi]
MSQSFRIPGKGRLSPSRGLRFFFDGKAFDALEGDTVASALLANGVHLAGRSYKYHRPRGILTAGSEEPNALIGVSNTAATHVPNVRATVQEVHDGLVTRSQNRWPSLAFDLGAVNSLGAPFFSAGFYYKTFMWPKAAWKALYEPVIRQAAGLGVSPKEPDPDHYASRYEHCDVLVVGGGAVGLAAALAAANAGASVILCDEQAQCGGAMRHESGARISGRSGWDWAQDAVAQLKAMDNVRVLTRTTAFGYHTQNFVALAERVTDHLADGKDLPRERLWQVRAKRVILATGAIERQLVFGGNDLPGVMFANAARTYLNHYGVAAGRKVAVFTACDSAYGAAFDLARAGSAVAVIVDWRHDVPEDLSRQAQELGIKILAGHRVVQAKGRLRIASISVAHRDGGQERSFPVDSLIISGGWTPSVHLYSQSRGKVAWDADTQRFLPGDPVQDCVTVGACDGTDDLARGVAQGIEAGKAAATAAGHAGGDQPDVAVEACESYAGGLAGDAGQIKGKAFVDYQNDVTAKDIRQAVREGMHSIEHVKRFTTNGMASDQGKLSNMHGLAIAADSLGWPIPDVGLTTFRQPYTPVTFGTIVNHGRGDLFDVTRRTTIDGWAQDNGAVFEDVGNWKRARFFPQGGEDMHAAVNRECRTVREAAGLFDASTLGKIEVVGPDAGAFMDLMYTNPMSKLGVGKLRYGIMCREDGFVYDDGVVGRVAEDRFHVTTTTGGAPRVLHHMEDYLQTEFPHLKVWLTSVTEQWAVVAVQGPKAREIVAPFVSGVDLSTEAFPHMSMAECEVCGVPARLFRVSFTGETGFEINVPAAYGRSVWEILQARGAEFGACTYGTETMHVLRAEKGYIIVGQDTDGTVTPFDAGYGWAVAKKKKDFVGIRGLKRPDLVADGRKQLVGLTTSDPAMVLEEGAQIVADPNQPVPMTMIGHVTSSYWSENCGRSIALALVAGGRDRMGQTLHVPMPDRTIAVTVTEPVFFDPKGERLHG